MLHSFINETRLFSGLHPCRSSALDFTARMPGTCHASCAAVTMSIRTLILLLSLPVLSSCTMLVPRPEGEALSVRFIFRAPSAVSVSLVGNFNQWDPVRDALHGPDADGTWTIDLPLPSGRYEYRFVVNGTEWVPDPRAPSVDDGMGGVNSLVIVRQ